MNDANDAIERLRLTLRARAGADPTTSYTASLLAGGVERAGKKFAEEAAETLIAAVAGHREQVISESADLLYHWLVLLQVCGVEWSDVLTALDARVGVSGHAEKAARTTPEVPI